MFQKKQIIYSESLGLCQVENIVNLTAQKGGKPVQYYLLKPLQDDEKSAYIPVENHQVMLRELFTEEEALALAAGEEIKKDENLRNAVKYVLGDKFEATQKSE